MSISYPSVNSSKPSLESVAKRVQEISTLPHIALRVMQVASDSQSGAADLKCVMENDAAMSARVLRCVNSAAYALRSKITNLQQAIAYVGLKQIRNLAMTATVSELFKKDESIGTYRRRGLWRHLVSVGICARLLAMRRKLESYEDAFLAGLLHDMGIILEDQQVHERFGRVIRSLGTQTSLVEAERAQLGFDHTLLGEKLAEEWRFPEVVRSSIRYHHTSVLYRGPSVDVVRCVDVANLICTLKGISSVGAKLVTVCGPALAGLSLTTDDLAVLSEDLDEELRKNESLFSL
jgi:HD-like signal output (HDOD) protein